MICKMGSEQYYRVKDLLHRRCGVAAQEWLHLLNREKGGVEVYVEDSFKGCMILHKGVNVFIATDSETTLREFLAVLDEKEGYAFRCSEWMASLVTARFKPGKEDYTGVILLTYYTDQNMFRKYTNARYPVQPISEDAAEEIQAHARRGFTQEFIQERIRKGYFYSVHQKNELISWVGTLWESEEACEVAFAYTKEEHRGKGLIKMVASAVTEKVLMEGKVPVAHTVETNIPAIKALEGLGYRLAAREWAYFSARN